MINSRSTLWIVGGLTVLAAVLRMNGLNSELWFDEIKTLVEYVRKPLPEILTHYSKSNHLLYSVLAHASLNVFGEHPWSLRLPAVVFGVACIPALYTLGTMIASQLEALLAAGLLAVSYHHIWFSQDARGYTALVFWTLLSTMCFLRCVRDKRFGWPIAYGMAAALGIYTHLSMLFVVAAHCLMPISSLSGPYLGEARPTTAHVHIGVVLAIVLSASLYAPVFRQIHQAFYQRSPDPQIPVATFHWAFWETLRNLNTGLGIGGTVICGLLLGLGLLSYWKQDRLLFSTMTLPVTVMAAGLLILPSPVRPRFFFLFIGFGLLMVVRGAMLAAGWASDHWNSSFRRRPHPTLIGVALVGIIMLANISSLEAIYRYPKQDYEGALRFIEMEQAPEDRVLTAGVTVMPYRDYYRRGWQSIETGRELHAVRSEGGRVWMVYAFPEYLEPALASSIRQECPPVRTFYGTLGGGEIVVCTVQTHTASGTMSD